jgi:VanZ family protein
MCRRWARWAFFVGIAVSFGIAIYPKNLNIILLNYSDKLDHAVIFFLSAFFLKLGWNVQTVRIIVVLLFYGLLMEFVQIFLPAHTADWKDFIADIVGLVPGIMVGIVAQRKCKQ